MTEKEKRILESWRFHDEEDLSTEIVLQMVCDDCECGVADVMDVICSVWEEA